MLTLTLTLLPNILSKCLISLFDFQNQKIATLRCDKQQKLLFFTSTFWVKRVGKFPNQHSKSLALFYKGEYERELKKFIVVAKIFLHHLEKKNFMVKNIWKCSQSILMLLVHKNSYQFVSVICLCAMHLLFRV